MIRVSVSNLDRYASYLADEDFPLDVLLRDLRGQSPRTPAMERGHAFAKAMEQFGAPPPLWKCTPTLAEVDDSLRGYRPVPDRFASDQDGYPFLVSPVGSEPVSEDMLIADGHAFAFTCDAEIEAWRRRELKAEKDYDGITVSARCDRLYGSVIADDKTTESFSKGGVERYIDKWQWKYYLDIFGAHEFVWHIWECREIKFKPSDYPGIKAAWEVHNHHVIKNYRYPELESECREFARGFKNFAEGLGLVLR